MKNINAKIQKKAENFAKYKREKYNEGRDILAVLGSFGVTFTEDVEELVKGLVEIGEKQIADEIREILNKPPSSGQEIEERLFLIFIWGDVEPHVHGPFPCKEDRDNKALTLRAEYGEEAGYFPATITAEGQLIVDVYSGEFFEDADSE